MNHKCLYCGSPCELTLATTSEGCSNPTCRAAKTPASEVFDIHTRNAAKMFEEREVLLHARERVLEEMRRREIPVTATVDEAIGG